MKIPTGWPTEEMIDAGERVDPNDHASKGSWVQSVLEAALAAAPTPPCQHNRQEGDWNSGKWNCLDCGETVEGPITPTPPAHNPQLLSEIHKLCNLICNSLLDTTIKGEIESRAFAIAHYPEILATPPAQEAEPVAIVENDFLAVSVAIRTNKDRKLGAGTKLYTHPANDDLREAEPVAIPSDEQLEDVLLPLMREHLTAQAVRQLTHASWKDGIDIERVDTDMMQLVKKVLALYTHAPSDKLRQAAEELIKAYEDGDETYLYNAVQDLRTELKGKS